MEYYATDYHELKKSFKKRVEIEKIPILLICLEDKVYAIHDKCPHLGASLDKGDYKDGAVRCKAHGATIDVKTGEIRESAKILFVKISTNKAKTFPTIIKDDQVFIEM